VTPFRYPDFDAHEQVSLFVDAAAGLRVIVAIHRSGPLRVAGGGCRIWRYRDERAAMRDALRLSRAMSYKLALLGMPIGGAKAVVLADPARDKSEALLAALGRVVNQLGGRFIIGSDVGSNPADLARLARITPYVSPEPPAGDGAAATAYGVLVALRTALARRLPGVALSGATVAVQGLGRVGACLCKLLRQAGARLIVSDVDGGAVARVVTEVGATAVAPEAIFDQAAAALAPCALGDVLDARTVARLRCAVVAGSANNPLTDARVADALAARNILYAPDIAVNLGAVIAAACGGDARRERERLDAIAPLLLEVFARAERERVSTLEAAERLARERGPALSPS
jgi:leucine dehydrogenase